MAAEAAVAEGGPPAAPAVAPLDYIHGIAESSGAAMGSAELAAALDAHDELAPLRSRFHVPALHAEHFGEATIRTGAAEQVYLCGNSLGLMPKDARKYVEEELKKWEDFGVEGHFLGARPWLTVDETVKASSARIVGAKEEEVVIMNTLTTNLHLMMVPFYRPTAERFRIVVEAKAFPSDAYAVQSQAKVHGFDPKDAIREVHPRDGEDLIRTEDLVAAIDDSVALVLIGGVHYYTGQLLDIQTITAAGHAAGAIVGVDLAHAVGNVSLHLHDWGVDFACWCTYKYLNSGPGSIAGCFVHERHRETDRPRFAGWWGHRKDDRFVMHHNFVPSPGAAGFQLSNPPVLPCAALRASLDLFDEATMPRLRLKSERLTAYLEFLIRRDLSDQVSILTPSDRRWRGSQLSLTFRPNVKVVYKRLAAEGVVVDIREPHAMRVAPAALYNSFSDVSEFVRVLRLVLDQLAEADLLEYGSEAAAGGAASS